MGKFDNDSLGTRMKEFYENITRLFLPRRTYTIMRVDGKAFHTYTKGLQRPFCPNLTEDMDETAKFLCQYIQGAKYAYVQSDEISILITDFDDRSTSAWFDNNIQKMVSVSASMATAKFNDLRRTRFEHQAGGFMRPPALAMFDSRVFTISSPYEVQNYFVWRQQDAVRNSISSVAQANFSHSELNGKNTTVMQDMLIAKGINWNDFDAKYKRGRFIFKETYEKAPNVFRNRWVSIAPPIFSQEKDFLNNLTPKF